MARRFKAIVLLLTLVVSHAQVVIPGAIMRTIATSGGGGVSFSDDFNRADSTNLGANWSEVAGDAGINSNQLRFSTGSFTDIWVIWVGQDCSTITQYGKITMTTQPGASWFRFVFRYVNSVSEFYVVELNTSNGDLSWQHWTAVGGVSTELETGTIGSVAVNDTFAVTVTGTGNGTVIRCWKNPTGNAPDAGGTTWGSAAPTDSMSNDPADPVDSGLKIGVGNTQSGADSQSMDAFFAGDVP